MPVSKYIGFNNDLFPQSPLDWESSSIYFRLYGIHDHAYAPVHRAGLFNQISPPFLATLKIHKNPLMY